MTDRESEGKKAEKGARGRCVNKREREGRGWGGGGGFCKGIRHTSFNAPGVESFSNLFDPVMGACSQHSLRGREREREADSI